jgi:addiction module HigA family antidote
MLTTPTKPPTVGEILTKDFMKPRGVTPSILADAMGLQYGQAKELCNGRRNVNAATALLLARVFGNRPEFWLNAQHRLDLWTVMQTPHERERIHRAKPLV